MQTCGFTTCNENNIDFFGDGFNRNCSDNSAVNEGSHQYVDYTDLWVLILREAALKNDNGNTKSAENGIEPEIIFLLTNEAS